MDELNFYENNTSTEPKITGEFHPISQLDDYVNSVFLAKTTKNNYAIKRLNDDSNEEVTEGFTTDSKAISGDGWSDVKHFVRIHGTGLASLNKGTKQPALMMDYGGMDLRKLQTSDLYIGCTKSCQDAYAAKVMLTMLECVEDIHCNDKHKKITGHKDLIDKNVLSGISSIVKYKKEDYEDKLINSAIKICDPKISSLSGTLGKRNPLNSDDLEGFLRSYRQLDTGMGSSKEGTLEYDLISVFAVYKYMLQEQDNGSLQDFIKNKFGMSIYDSQSKSRKFALSKTPQTKLEMNQLKKICVEKILGKELEGDTYLTILQRKNSGPLVLRPIDRFKRKKPQWSEKDGAKLLTKVKQFAEVGKSSYQSTLKLVQKFKKTSEQKKVEEYYVKQIHKGILAIDSYVDELLKEVGPKIEERDLLDKKLNDLASAITLTNVKRDGLQGEMKNISSNLGKADADYSSLAKQVEDKGKEITQVQNEINQLCNQHVEAKGARRAIQEKISETDVGKYKDVTIYLTDKSVLHENLNKETNDVINELLTDIADKIATYEENKGEKKE